MARPCFIANCKMNKTVAETLAYLTLCEKHLSAIPQKGFEVIFAPPYTALFAANQRIKEIGLLASLAAQNVFFETDGAYTGEISPRMLCEVGCQYVIVGHSERRNAFGESDAVVSAKVLAAMGAGLMPILCVGETAKERLEGKTLEVVLRQVRAGFSQTGRFDLSRCMVAYEPIWAIGTGETPVASEVEQVHKEIAETLREMREACAGLPRILYGGSVNEKNVAAFIKEPHVDGMLVGGASLSAETFAGIIQLGMVSL